MNSKSKNKKITFSFRATPTVENKYELCKVCRYNHNQGRRHNYLPKHVQLLSSYLNRFRGKLSELKDSLENPKRNGENDKRSVWCVFCDVDVNEIGSEFAWGDTIEHMAGKEHLKKLKEFLWKYGGGMDRVGEFMVSENDLTKWQKKCRLLMRGAESSSSQQTYGPSTDIQNELSFIHKDKIDIHAVESYRSSSSNGLNPLQSITNEKHQVLYPEVPSVAKVGASPHDVTIMNGFKDSQSFLYINKKKCSDEWIYNNGGYLHDQGYQDERLHYGQTSNNGPLLQNPAHISSPVPKIPAENVHSGALPPWLETINEIQPNIYVNSSKKLGKTQKLNPNRVGAAWAEKRKIELEMEKRGDIVTSKCDADWLPNFGRVWQSGSRKESKKEFGIERQKMPKTEILSEAPLTIKPYISKRMRREADTGEGVKDGQIEEITNSV